MIDVSPRWRVRWRVLGPAGLSCATNGQQSNVADEPRLVLRFVVPPDVRNIIPKP
jgi:hypothetical protein